MRGNYMGYKADKIYDKKNWRRVKECIHSHSIFCHHALHTPEEMVVKAIKEKYEIFGLSEHCPFLNKRDGKIFHNMRPTIGEYEILLKEMNRLKSKYKNEITILNGVESEYYKGKEEYLKSLIKSNKADYIILGNHSSEFGIYYSEELSKKMNHEELFEKYALTATKAMETGLFIYMAHPDFIFKNYLEKWNATSKKLAHTIFAHAKKFDYAVGFNINGMRFVATEVDGYERMRYPVKEFWKIAKEYGVKIFIEQDAHNKEMLEQIYWDKAVSLIEEWNLTDQVIGIKDLNIEKYQNKIKNM